MEGLGVYELEVTNHSSCEFTYIGGPGPSATGCAGLSATPDSLLVFSCETNAPVYFHGLKEIDQMTGQYNDYFAVDWPVNIDPTGIVSVGEGIFYGLTYNSINNSTGLYKIDVNSGSLNYLGDLPYISSAEMTLFNGEIYYSWHTLPFYYLRGIVKVDTVNPAASELVVEFSGNLNIRALTATDICNTLLAATEDDSDLLYYINLIDGVITPLCQSLHNAFNISGLVEFMPPDCSVYLDLDNDDSSGLLEADFESDEFDCHSDGVPVSDHDIHVLYDALMMEMTIEIVGFIPDGPAEILQMTGSVPNIDVIGNGSGMITLSNAGDAKSTDFKQALRQIKYNNTLPNPTEGLRTVEVQFSTESGAMSNIATAYIQVNQLPFVFVDLGDDLEICEGQTATFDAGNTGASYLWSTDQTSQSITVDNSGIYSVTVTDGINCPGEDAVMLDVIPLIHVSLSGDSQICDNQNASISIITDSSIPIDIEILSSTGSFFSFSNVSGAFTFMDLLSEDTEYIITNVTSTHNVCIEPVDSIHIIELYQSYTHSFETGICEGDSIWLGHSWESEAGVYENSFTTFEGCDSIVTTTITLQSEINITVQGTSCDSSAIGNFITFLPSQGGCDTVLTTVITLMPGDSTFHMGTTCISANAGVSTQVLTNQMGCDSIVITTVALQAPSDTTFIFQISCDPSQIGVFQDLLIGNAGCDSLVIISVSAAEPDTTFLNTTSCDSASLGVFEEHFNSVDGCDSLVITSVSYSSSDSVYIQDVTCEQAQAGVFIQNLLNRFGCDSIVTSSVALAISHSLELTSASCNPADTGVFIQTFINQSGCDSIVTTTISMLPNDDTYLSSTTCTSSQAGMFITTHLNQHGCDSIVTHSVSLVPADTTIFSFKTCDPGSVGRLESTFPNQEGCDSLVIEETTLFPLPELQIEVTSDFNGYHISCFGESDGSVIAEVNGIQPWTFLWSTGNNDQGISGLSAGSYSVLVTDGNGCTTEDEVLLYEPDPFSITFLVSQPDCFDHSKGSIAVQQTGGVEPVRYSIDGINYQASSIFNDLSGGTYTITALDANDCEVKEIIWINVPLMVHVELGDDQIIYPGDTSIINAIVNVPFDSLAGVTWSGLLNPNCPNCLSQPVAPIITTTYSVTVTSNDGCKDDDAMTLFVVSENDVYIPNIFSPNGDGINDLLVIYGGSGVEEISEIVIFDRWGNLVYSANNFQPNSETRAWDGKMKGEDLNPAVFAYKMIVRFENGESNIRYGDITLVR